MNLKKYDKKCIRLSCIDGKDYEGKCSYYSSEYCEHEHGVKEDCLEIVNFVFYEKDIKEIKILKKKGEFGVFSAPYGEIEKVNILDGIDAIEDQLYSDEFEDVYRMLMCLKDYFELDIRLVLEIKEEIIEVLNDLLLITKNSECREAAKQLLKNIE